MRISIGDVHLFVEIIGQQYVFTGEEMVQRPTLIGLHGGPGQDGTTMRRNCDGPPRPRASPLTDFMCDRQPPVGASCTQRDMI